MHTHTYKAVVYDFGRARFLLRLARPFRFIRSVLFLVPPVRLSVSCGSLTVKRDKVGRAELSYCDSLLCDCYSTRARDYALDT